MHGFHLGPLRCRCFSLGNRLSRAGDDGGRRLSYARDDGGRRLSRSLGGSDLDVEAAACSLPPMPSCSSAPALAHAGSSPAISASPSPSFLLGTTLSFIVFFGGISDFALGSPWPAPAVVETTKASRRTTWFSQWSD